MAFKCALGDLTTGYGCQTKITVPRLKSLGYDTSITAFYGHEGTPINWNGIPVYGKGNHPYGNDVMSAHAKHFGAQILISLVDAWVIQPDMIFDGLKWVPWFPVDSEPLPPPVANAVRQAYKRIVFSKFGERMVKDAGMDCYYVPHSVETDVFKPSDRVQARERLRWPMDKFIVGMVAANKGYPPRKAFFEHLTAFKAFHTKHPDAMLYLHTDDGSRGGIGVDIIPYLDILGLKYTHMLPGRPLPDDAAVVFPDQHTLLLGYPDDYMNAAYNAMDVHMLVSCGEGFGIPILEAQSAGCPVIVGDWTAMSELCFSGWKVPKSETLPLWTQLQAWQYQPYPGAIYERLEMAYRMRGNDDYRKRARDGALQYDADKVAEKYWRPVLAEIEASLSDNPSASPVVVVGGKHEHKWAPTGLFNADDTMSIPCLDAKCDAELVVSKHGGASTVKPHGFKMEINGIPFDIEDDPQGGVAKIVCREVERDYRFDFECEPGDVLVDIGAHVGVVACYLAKRYPQAEIRAYEPVRGNYERLMRNLNANGIENVEAHPFAVTGDGRPVKIGWDTTQNSGGRSIYEPVGVMVESVTLAEISDKSPDQRIRLLKIDCEGAEYEILTADESLLDRVDYLAGEFHANSTHDPAELLELCQRHIPADHIHITISQVGDEVGA